MSGPAQWIFERRLFPLLAVAVLIVVGMATTTWWGPHFVGSSQWQLPGDLWGTLVAAHRVLHLDFAAVYTPPTGLVSFPGAAIALLPAVALMDALGLGLAAPAPANPHPSSWIVAGPYEIALSGVVIFASDAIAERSGVSRPKRFVLAAAQGVALWSVSVRWGHPEDAVAVGLLLYGVLALSEGASARSAWLVGAALAVQPLVLLALPVLVVLLDTREILWYLLRAACLPALLVAVSLGANWHATLQAIADQPNWPSVDHPTPWVALAPRMSHGAVSAGPGRAIAIVVACAIAAFAERRWRARVRVWIPNATGPPMEEVLWVIAAELTLRSVFESVMVAYYVWPVLAIALVSSARSWRRLVGTSLFACASTFTTQLGWHSRWGWWAMALAGIALVLVVARGRTAQGNQETWPFNKTYPTNAPVSIRA